MPIFKDEVQLNKRIKGQKNYKWKNNLNFMSIGETLNRLRRGYCDSIDDIVYGVDEDGLERHARRVQEKQMLGSHPILMCAIPGVYAYYNIKVVIKEPIAKDVNISSCPV